MKREMRQWTTGEVRAVLFETGWMLAGFNIQLTRVSSIRAHGEGKEIWREEQEGVESKVYIKQENVELVSISLPQVKMTDLKKGNKNTVQINPKWNRKYCGNVRH